MPNVTCLAANTHRNVPVCRFPARKYVKFRAKLSPFSDGYKCSTGRHSRCVTYMITMPCYEELAAKCVMFSEAQPSPSLARGGIRAGCTC